MKALNSAEKVWGDIWHGGTAKAVQVIDFWDIYVKTFSIYTLIYGKSPHDH